MVSMGKDHTSVRLEPWIKEALERFTEKNRFKTSASALRFLLEDQLNRYGYFERDYRPDMVDAPSGDVKQEIQETSENTKEKLSSNESKTA